MNDKLHDAISFGCSQKKAAESTVTSQVFCIEDTRFAKSIRDTPIVQMGELLSQLVGKMVLRVEWVQQDLPDTHLGRYIIYTAGGTAK